MPVIPWYIHLLGSCDILSWCPVQIFLNSFPVSEWHENKTAYFLKKIWTWEGMLVCCHIFCMPVCSLWFESYANDSCWLCDHEVISHVTLETPHHTQCPIPLVCMRVCATQTDRPRFALIRVWIKYGLNCALMALPFSCILLIEAFVLRSGFKEPLNFRVIKFLNMFICLKKENAKFALEFVRPTNKIYCCCSTLF